MNNKNKNNSIIFLTTLSVYLGLVLVGGVTPSVLAQAATTKNFNVQDEIEVKDDLDKKPDDCEKLRKLAEEKLQFIKSDNQAFLEYTKILKNLVELSWKIDSEGFSFEFKSKPNFDALNFRETSFENLGRPKIYPRNARQEIEEEANKLFNLLPKQPNSDIANFEIKFESSNKELKIATNFLQKDELVAHKIPPAYRASLDCLRCEATKKFENLVLRNTEIFSENNQVFIVTRLPRGSLDELLEQDAKAESK